MSAILKRFLKRGLCLCVCFPTLSSRFCERRTISLWQHENNFAVSDFFLFRIIALLLSLFFRSTRYKNVSVFFNSVSLALDAWTFDVCSTIPYHY